MVTTTTTTEHLNSVVRRTPTPTNNYSDDVNGNIVNTNHKLRSWSGLNGNNNNNNWQSNGSPSPINLVNGYKNSTDKTSELFQVNNNLTNWKSTAATATQSDKQIVIDKSNVNEIKIQPREAYNVSLII